MRLMQSKRGQSMGEYAILFAIVLGAAVAMQQYVKTRIQGGIMGTADNYSKQAVLLGGYGTLDATNATVRTVDSTSNTVMDMKTATTGTVKTDSDSTTNVTK